jgi:hypothetical protein
MADLSSDRTTHPSNGVDRPGVRIIVGDDAIFPLGMRTREDEVFASRSMIEVRDIFSIGEGLSLKIPGCRCQCARRFIGPHQVALEGRTSTRALKVGNFGLRVVDQLRANEQRAGSRGHCWPSPRVRSVLSRQQFG